MRWLCQEVWPIIQSLQPDACLDIVGLGHESLTDLANLPGVYFHGFVDHLDEMIDDAVALVVPLRIAGGTRIKILEAWAKGLPVASTSLGAEGLSVTNGKNVLIGDSPDEFAQACLALLNDSNLRSKLAQEGYIHGKRMFDWLVIQQKIEQILGSV